MIKAFQQLYKDRIALAKLQTEEEIRKLIRSELKDEFTHPRVRLSLDKKYALAIARVQSSRLSEQEKQAILSAYREEYSDLSTGYEV